MQASGTIAVTSAPWLIVPVKRTHDALRRLGDVLAPAERAALAGRLAARTLAVVAAAAVPRVVVVTADSAVTDKARQHGFDVLLDQATDHSGAVMQGMRWAANRGAIAVAALSADLPLLQPDDVRFLLGMGAPHTAVLAPDRLGTGTSALVLQPATALRPAFGPDSLRRHLRRAADAGLAVRLARTPGLAVDLDVPADLDLQPRDGDPFAQGPADR